MSGRVYLVGAGPWDPGLLTVRGRALLSRADTVLYDYLVNPALLEHTSPDAKLIPTGVAQARMSQTEICERLVEECQAGRQVVRLKGGDPFVFGRGGEEAEALSAAGLPFEVVPGVTAAVAACAYAGIPVTHRDFGSSLGICTGHTKEDAADPLDWSALAAMTTIVFYMSAKRLGRIQEKLLEAGRSPDTPVGLIRWATRPDQTVVETTLADMTAAAQHHGLAAPLTVIIGSIVGLRSQISWYEHRPLHGRRIVVTRSQRQSGQLIELLSDSGAEVLSYPAIKFEAMTEAFDAVLSNFSRFDWVVFTSVNGVDYFLDQLLARGADLRLLSHLKIACVGPATEAGLLRRGLRADVVPKKFVAEGLLDALASYELAGNNILIPRALVARDTLPDALSDFAHVTILPVYKTVAGDVDPNTHARVAAGEADMVTFTSSSTVSQFVARFSEKEIEQIKANCVVACIGPITAKTASAFGFRVVAVAAEYTVPGLLLAARQYFGDVDNRSLPIH